MKPGEIITSDGDIVINKNSKSLSLTVSNKGDRPIQVGSHYHFAESNDYLDFDRKIANGKRGKIFNKILDSWSKKVKLDIEKQIVSWDKTSRETNKITPYKFK